MAAPIYTLATVTINPDGTISLGNRPADAYALATVAAGGDKPPLPEANFAGGATQPSPIALLLTDTPPYFIGDPPVQPWVEYAITGDWNTAGVDATVYVPGITTRRWASLGYILDTNGDPQTVTVSVAAGTYAPFAAGGPVGTPRDPYDVDTAKRKEVVDANLPAYVETDSAYYGKEFVDEVYGPNKPSCYRCLPTAPASVGGATLWKWFRFDIL